MATIRLSATNASSGLCVTVLFGAAAALGAALWDTIARYHDEVHVQRNPIELDVVKYSTNDLGVHVPVARNVKFGEQSHNGFVASDILPPQADALGSCRNG